MRPEEKAKELVDKFANQIPFREHISDTYGQQCALIAVDEILNAYPLYPPRTPGPSGNNARTYWQQVKEAIEKL